MALTQLIARDFVLPLGERSYSMGILNVTPDSFSDGGLFFNAQAAVAQALQLQAAGADILDIGAQSTRPGFQHISAQEEIERLQPVFKGLKGKLHIPISVDTFYPECAAFALEQGAAIINDVSGVVAPEMAGLVKQYHAAWVLMHNGGGAARQTLYPQGILEAVRQFFQAAVAQAEQFGVPREQLCLDPGFGFGKSNADNLLLLRQLGKVKSEGICLLAAFSRKRFLAQAGQIDTSVMDEAALQRLDAASICAQTVAIAQGADILRMHAVQDAVAAAHTADCLLRESF